jgi:hypothetical protein
MKFSRPPWTVAEETSSSWPRSRPSPLLRLRDAGEINDRVHEDLQLELDREHADLGATPEPA